MNLIEVMLYFLLTIIGIAAATYMWFGDTVFFSFAEQLFIGGTSAMTLFSTLRSLNSQVVNPVMTGKTWLIIPLIAGLLTFTRLTRYRWTARYPVALLAGVGLGISIGPTIDSDLLGAITQTVGNVVTGYPNPVSSVIILISVVFVIIFFMYSSRFAGPMHTGRFSYIARIGRIFFFAGIGYLYASVTVFDGLDFIMQIWQTVFGRSWGFLLQLLHLA
jgi:hypothetical protein